MPRMLGGEPCLSTVALRSCLALSLMPVVRLTGSASAQEDPSVASTPDTVMSNRPPARLRQEEEVLNRADCQCDVRDNVGQQSTYRSARVAKRPREVLEMQIRVPCAVQLLRAGCVANHLLLSAWPAPCSVKSKSTRRVSCLLASETVMQSLGG